MTKLATMLSCLGMIGIGMGSAKFLQGPPAATIPNPDLLLLVTGPNGETIPVVRPGHIIYFLPINSHETDIDADLKFSDDPCVPGSKKRDPNNKRGYYCEARTPSAGQNGKIPFSYEFVPVLKSPQASAYKAGNLDTGAPPPPRQCSQCMAIVVANGQEYK